MTSEKLKNFHVEGLSAAPATPFKENGDLNLDLIPDYVQHYIDFGIDNAFVAGTTGEGNSMTLPERKLVAEAWVKAAKGKLSSVTIHIGTGNLRDSQELARHAASIGADAIACVGTTYHKPENVEQYVYYMRDVAAEAPEVPFYLYDIDFITGIPITAAEFFSLADKHIPTLKGTKHTSPNFTSMIDILRQFGDKYQVMLGSDEYYLPALAQGIRVSICSTYMGNLLNRIRANFDRNDLDAARKDQEKAIAFQNIRRKHNISIPGFAKAMLRVLGLPMGSPRCPYAPITEEVVETVRRELDAIGFNDWAKKK